MAGRYGLTNKTVKASIASDDGTWGMSLIGGSSFYHGNIRPRIPTQSRRDSRPHNYGCNAESDREAGHRNAGDSDRHKGRTPSRHHCLGKSPDRIDAGHNCGVADSAHMKGRIRLRHVYRRQWQVGPALCHCDRLAHRQR